MSVCQYNVPWSKEEKAYKRKRNMLQNCPSYYKITILRHLLFSELQDTQRSLKGTCGGTQFCLQVRSAYKALYENKSVACVWQRRNVLVTQAQLLHPQTHSLFLASIATFIFARFGGDRRDKMSAKMPTRGYRRHLRHGSASW